MKVTQNPPKFLSRKCAHFAFVIIEGQLLLGLQSVLWLSSETKRLCDIYNRHLNMIMKCILSSIGFQNFLHAA